MTGSPITDNDRLGRHAPRPAALPLRPRRGGGRRPPVEDFVLAARAGDLGTTHSLAAEYLGQVRSRTALVTDLLAPAMASVARLWRFGRATADDENNVAKAIADVNEAVSLDRPKAEFHAPRALLVTIEPELHSLGLRLVGTALREDGWEWSLVTGIGRAELVDAVTNDGVGLVVISCTYVSALSELTLTGAVQALNVLGKPVILGGQALERNPDLARTVGAKLVAHDPRSAMVMVRRFRERDRRRPKRDGGRAPRPGAPSREATLPRARL